MMPAALRKPRLARWRALALETHISLPVFALVLLAGVWAFTLHLVENERADADAAARTTTQELIDTYEAQVARNLAGIDQTLKVIKYAAESNGARAAIPLMEQKGLLPSGMVFVISIVDRYGMTVASNPAARFIDVSHEGYFRYHADNNTDSPYVSRALRDAANAEWHLHFSRRLNDARGHFDGVAIVEVDPAYFTSGYEHARQGEHGMLGLSGDDGIYRAVRVGDTVSWGQPARNISSRDAGVQASWDGVRRYTAVRQLHTFPLWAVVGLSEQEQQAAFGQRRRNYLLAAASGSAALVLVVAVICGWSWQAARARRRAQRAQETYAAASEASLDAFFVLRSVHGADGGVTDFRIEATNTRAERLTRRSKAELRGQLLLELMPQLRANGIFDDLVHTTIVGGVHEAEWENEYSERPQWLHRQVVRVEDGIVAIVRDITERKQSEQRIVHMAHHDELTGLPNRSLIRDRLDQAIRHARRNTRSVALAFIDLDGFKLVNDGLGHNAGDELLKVVGDRMGACIRAGDTLGRFGGDEFVIVLPDLPDNPLAITHVLENVRQAVTEPVLVEGQQVQVSCSMGVVMYPRDGQDPNTLMMNADAAMYRAKEMGNNNFQFYTREMNASVEEKLVLLEGLRAALDEGQFLLHYQPKVSMADGRMFGVEALVRWNHPEHGMVPPARFIGLAEESGLIVALGEWVLRTACAQAQAWRDEGLPPLTVSVNMSPRQFEEKRLVERVAHALRESRLDPAALEIEVTESLIMRDLDQAVARMADLKAMGISLSIDDFGTGYSSLSALKSFPISSLKLDKSFVGELGENEGDQAIALAVISLGHKLGLSVIAEGVETEQQYQFLRNHGCDAMQGYLYSRPVAADQIRQMLAAAPAIQYACAVQSRQSTDLDALAQ